MEITERLLAVLDDLRFTKILNRQIVQNEHFPTAKDGAPVREFLRKMLQDGIVARFGSRSELFVQVAPAYVPTEKGCCLLANNKKDMKYLLDCVPRMSAQDVPHHLGMSRMLLDFRKALAAQKRIVVPEIFTEHCIVNPDEPDHAKRRKLFQVVAKSENKPNIVCSPDGVALVQTGKYVRAQFFEYETGSEGSPSRCAARKAPGYFGLDKGKFYKEYFPTANDMRVIAICPNIAWLQSFRRAMKDKQGAELWRFVSREELTKDTFLTRPIFWTCENEEPKCFVKPQEGTPPETPLVTPLEAAVAQR